jgi:hypothetical protein
MADAIKDFGIEVNAERNKVYINVSSSECRAKS